MKKTKNKKDNTFLDVLSVIALVIILFLLTNIVIDLLPKKFNAEKHVCTDSLSMRAQVACMLRYADEDHIEMITDYCTNQFPCKEWRDKTFCEKCEEDWDYYEWSKVGFVGAITSTCDQMCVCEEWQESYTELLSSHIDMVNIAVKDPTVYTQVATHGGECTYEPLIEGFKLECNWGVTCLSARNRTKCDDNEPGWIWYAYDGGWHYECKRNEQGITICSREYDVNMICKQRELQDVGCDELLKRILFKDKFCPSNGKWLSNVEIPIASCWHWITNDGLIDEYNSRCVS